MKSMKTPRARRLWAYLKPYLRMEFVAFLAMAIIAVLQLALPASIQYMIDSLIPALAADSADPTSWHKSAFFAGALISVYVIILLLSWLRDYLAAKIGGSIIADIRSQLFEHLELVSLRFYQKHQVGEVMSRMMSDVSRIQDLFTNSLLSLLTNVLFLIGILIYLFSLNWYLTLIALIPLPVTIYLTHRYGLKMNTISRTLQEAVAELSGRVQERLVGIKTIKAFGREREERERVDTVLDRLKVVYIKYSVNQSLARNFVQILSFAGVIVFLSIGAYLVASGSMKLGQLMAFFVLLTWLNMPIQALASANVEIQGIMASVDRVFEYLDYKREVVEAPSPVSITKARGVIVFDKVGFSYEEQSFRMENFNLTIAAGEKLAIVGTSGGGKSTIVNLAMRFYDPQQGSVTLDGIDLRKLSFQSLRDNIALVDQDPLLFNASIFENIAYSNPAASREEVVSAARVANIHDYIESLPAGYDTVVGERGVTLSGGEKQRLCLARAVLKDPPVLILDEATSALDSISEQLIQQALDKILLNKTAIIVAHRLSTVQRADRIITMKGGAIVDEGTHSELMSRSSIYRELAEKQLVKAS
ncbi:MAG: ABC transporter ATP-binding protein [bacterium]|nr:ABC transporter ATP-binding protein [bacterium]